MFIRRLKFETFHLFKELAAIANHIWGRFEAWMDRNSGKMGILCMIVATVLALRLVV